MWRAFILQDLGSNCVSILLLWLIGMQLSNALSLSRSRVWITIKVTLIFHSLKRGSSHLSKQPWNKTAREKYIKGCQHACKILITWGQVITWFPPCDMNIHYLHIPHLFYHVDIGDMKDFAGCNLDSVTLMSSRVIRNSCQSYRWQERYHQQFLTTFDYKLFIDWF